MTNSAGQAVVTLTSSTLIGAKATITATYGTLHQRQPLDVHMGAPKGDIQVVTPELVADGVSTTDVLLPLTFNHKPVFDNKPVRGHLIRWRISHVTDANGKEVDAVDGQYPGYGSLSPDTSYTNADGIAKTKYTVGTKAGEVEFEATDNSVWEDNPLANTGLRSGLSREVAQVPKTRPKWTKKKANYRTSRNAKVTFRASQPNRGFDYTTDPPWLVAPAGGTNTVVASISPSSAANSIRWTTGNSSIAVAQIPKNTAAPRITVFAKGAGQTYINAIGPDGGVAGRLLVSVKSLKRLTVNFFLVRDSARHRSPLMAMDEATIRRELDAILASANSYWLPQANVQFVKNTPQYWFNHYVPKDLGKPINTLNRYNDITSNVMISSPGTKADIHVFLTWKTTQHAGGASAGGTRNSVVGEPPYAGITYGGLMAHEVGHLFRLDDLYGVGDAGNLMFWEYYAQNQHIRKFQADAAHLYKPGQ